MEERVKELERKVEVLSYFTAAALRLILNEASVIRLYNELGINPKR